jgi:hypothetical protein
MKRRMLILGYLLLAFLSMHAQSAWRITPEKAEVARKKLRNTFFSTLYNDELLIEQAKVVDNRTLLLQMRSPTHWLEYRSVKVKKKGRNAQYWEIATIAPKQPLYFLPAETIQIDLDLSPFDENGEYLFTFKLYTELNEIFHVEVFLNTEEFMKWKMDTIIDHFPVYEKLQKDENYVYSWIEDYTEFPGGNKGLVNFIKENVRMGEVPADLYDFSYVSIGMIIDKDGSILYPEILDSDWREFDAEAMRLVNMMPKWKPGSIDGVKVKNRVMVYIYYKDLEKSCFVFDSYVWK